MKKYLRFTIYFLILLFTQFLLAQSSFAEDVGNNVDQRCWTKSDCETKAFGTFVGPNDETKSACKMEKDSTNNLIGFCLPTKQAQMGLNWGQAGVEKSTFTHIGDFIKWIYRYGIIAAGILAVVMIIIAGAVWVTSGGSQERVTAAKKKIGNALMGLFLVLMAYSVLNLINPYLVNFRLPSIWMINEAGLVPPYCDLIKDKKFFFAKETSSETYQKQYSEGQQKGFKPYDDEKPACGKEYYVEGGGGLTCKGSLCDTGSFCMSEEKKSVCKQGMLGGSLGAQSSFLCSDLTGNIVDNDIMLIAMCKSGELKNADKVNLPDSAREYLFSAKSNLESICGGKENLAGFYIGAEINDEGGGPVGSFCPGAWSSMGCDDWHAIGKSSPHNCDLNLAKKTLEGYEYNCENATYGSAYACACGGFSQKERVQIFANFPPFVQSLISLDELQGGYYCNIEISRSEFPALDNSLLALWSCQESDLMDPTSCFKDQ
ncbi:MAG: DUF1634 domain-containing protein [Candidatus Magasanikbacteria bacterium]|nr:DUF1634 domain-containing protein [Candidatus Magasanikbacteria bacterium]